MSRATLLALALLTAGVMAGCSSEPTATQPEPTTPTSGSGETASTETPKADEPKPEEPVAEAPKPPADKPKDGDEVAVLETGKGRIVLMFYPDRAPKHVANFLALANAKLYDGTRFHRCIADFMIQGGDPKSKDMKLAAEWGTGGNVKDGQEQFLQAEFNDIPHKRGVLSMARSQDPNSASSQFFIVQKDSNFLDGQYTAFGKVVSGMDVVDKIVVTGNPADNGSVDPKNAVLLKSVRIAKWPL